MKIQPNSPYCTVVVLVSGDPEAIRSVLDHAIQGPALFSEFAGFIGGSTHVAEDGTRILQYLQWRDKASHEDCLRDPKWASFPSSVHFMALVESGDIQVEVKTYTVAGCRMAAS